MAEDQEEASYIQQLADKSGAAELLKFKATVETALSGSPDMQALAKQTFAEATMHFKELPGDALRILRALKSGSDAPSAEELIAATTEVERVRRDFDFNLMKHCVSFQAAQSGLISPHSAPGQEPGHAKFAGGTGIAVSGGGVVAEATEGAGRTNPADRLTAPFPDTPLAGPSFSLGTTGASPGQPFTRELSFGGIAQPLAPDPQIAAMLATIMQPIATAFQKQSEVLSRQLDAKLQEHTKALEEKFAAFEQSKSASAPEGATSSADLRRGGGDGGNVAPDLSGVGQALFEGSQVTRDGTWHVSFGSEESEDSTCAELLTIEREPLLTKDVGQIGALGTQASEALTQLAENLIRLFLKPTTPAVEILEAKRALSTAAAEGTGSGAGGNCVLGPNGISLHVSLLSSIHNGSIPQGEDFLRARRLSVGGGDMRGLSNVSPESVLNLLVGARGGDGIRPGVLATPRLC